MPIIQTHKTQTAAVRFLLQVSNVYNYQVCYPAKPYRNRIHKYRKAAAQKGGTFYGPSKLTNPVLYGEVL